MTQSFNPSGLFYAPETTTIRDGKTFTLIMKGGGQSNLQKMKNYQYDHRNIDYWLHDPDGKGFYYLYGCPKTNSAELKRLQRFQAAGSDAPAPVVMYERD